MKYDIRLFRVNKDLIIKYYNEKGIDYISFVCSTSNVPVIAAYCFILEDYPNDQTAKQRLENILKFYDYEEVIS